YRKVFEKGLNTCWVLYHKTKDEKYLEKAFELSETNRNTTLLEGLQDSKFKLFGDISKDLLAFETEIKQGLELTKIDLYYEKTARSPDKEFISELLNQRILFSNRLDSLQRSFEINYPRYSNLKFQNKIITLSDIQKNIDNNTQLITYFLGENNLYTFNISNDKITFLKGKIANELLNKTKVFKSELIAQNDIKDISKKLHLYLLNQQLNKTKQNLVIIPDNVLNYIPFEILLNDDDTFLIEDYTISYTGSAHLFLELKNDFFNYSSPNYWAGFSPKYEDGFELSNISDEISIISKIVKGNKFIGEASKKQSFLDNNKNYSILHLAMHAEINNENPMFNKLIFSDGELSASEIYLSNTKANLVVLSACNTGFGKLEKGEGVMSMARAFHFSGVPSVIMSLWKVPDKETKIIMIAFYKHLEKGETKSEALKNAKLDYLASTNDIYLKHPYYWSGFVLNGNTNTLKQPKKYYYLISGGLILLGLIFWRKKSKLKKT
ncbi:MAG: CHAT domain-containing protein, partial [Flavobacteriaceae bacterium]|nr:CHAT domain-containing protein [Flavobacteriaceae bacterium]